MAAMRIVCFIAVAACVAGRPLGSNEENDDVWAPGPPPVAGGGGGLSDVAAAVCGHPCHVDTAEQCMGGTDLVCTVTCSTGRVVNITRRGADFVAWD